MTRQEVEAYYRVENGVIRNPGKFELQPLWVPVLWDIALNGFADTDDGEAYGFILSKGDALRTEFPELDAWLGRKRTVHLIESETGFVTAL